MANPQLTRLIRATWLRNAGRDYRIALDTLDDESLRELLRLLTDLEHETRLAVRRAQIMPWRK